MKTVRVAAAVICDSVKEKHKIFAVARATENLKIYGNSQVEK